MGSTDTIPIEPSEQSDRGPDAEDVRKGIEEAEEEEAEREQWLASPEAVRQREESHYAYADLDAAEAQDLLLATFSEQLAKLNIDPARWLSDGKIEQPLGESVAAVSKEGDTSLLDAGDLPVRAVNEEGDLRKVDLSLEVTSEGFKPVNPLAEVKIPDAADEPIELGERGIAVSAVGADASREAQLLGDKNVFYSEAQGPGTDTDRIVSPTSGGVEIFDLLRTADSPETLRYEIELPEGAELRSDGNRGAQAVMGDEILAWIPFPVAFDAQGTQVPVELEIEGSTIALYIEHREADVAHPILLDPHVHILEESVNYNWFNGGPTQGLDSGVWEFVRNAGNNWTGGSRWCIYHCWGQRGLYVFMPGGAHWGGEFGHWKYPAPTATSYLVNAWIIPFWRWDHNCGGKGKYAQPHDYVGMWDTLGNKWKQPVRIDEAIDVGSVDLQHAGDALIFGLGTGPGSTTPCHRDLAAGGVAVWLDDSDNPSVNAVSGLPGGWIGNTSPFLISVNVTDPGLGVGKVKLGAQGRAPNTQQVWCNGLSYNRCPTNHNELFEVSGASFDEGIQSVMFSAKDITEKDSNTLEKHTKVDLTPPEVTLNGQLAIATEEDKGEAQGDKNVEKLRLPVYNLKIEATDIGTEGSTEQRTRSGVKSIEVSLDGQPQSVPWDSNPTPCDSCSMTKTYPLKLANLTTAGIHTLEVKVKDQVGHPRNRTIEFEYFPATGMKDEYVMHYFPLPDGQGNEAEEEHPDRPELAVNVMNGNLVYREQDIDVEGPAVDLEVERYYNSQLPEAETTEWGDGWTLAQTPDLEPVDTGGSPAPDEADLLESSGAIEQEVALPTEAGAEEFDPALQATLAKRPGGGYELTDETGESATSVVFDETGQTEAEVTEGFAKVDYSYEGGELAEIAVEDPGSAAYPSGEPFSAPDPVLAYAASFGSTGTGNGQFNRPGDLAIAPNGDIWVADTENDRIQHFDSNGNYIGQFGSTGAGNGQLNRPSAIKIGAGGNVIVVDSLNHRLQWFSQAGAFLAKFGAFGSAEGLWFNTPTDFAIDSEGKVWVSDRENGRIQKFGPGAAFLKAAGTSGPGDLGEPMGIDIGPDDEVFVADRDQHRVVVFDSAGEYLRAFGTEGDGPGEFDKPAAIEIDTQGNVWVADTGNHRIQQFDLQGNYVDQFGTEGSGAGEMDLTAPMGIETDAKGSIWLTDPRNARVQLWVLDEYMPTYADSFGSGGSGDGQLDGPGDVAIAPDGDIWVADALNNRIQHFDSDGTYIGQFGSTGTGNGQFERPRGIEFDPAGNIWVLDSLNHRLQAFNQAGQFLGKGGTYGASNGQLKTPKGFAIDAAGNFWIADTGNARIQKFSPNGSFLKVAGISGPGDLTEPMAIDISPEGEVFVADWAQNRVVVFDSEGEYERAFGTEGEGGGQFNHPGGVGIDTQGNVWVGDSDNHRIQQFDVQGNYVTQFGSEGGGDGEMDLSSPIGIATDAEGSIWIADAGNDRVQLWEAPPAPPTDEELLADDPEVQVEVASDLVTGVVGDEAGEHSYEHDGDLLTAHEGPSGEITYEYDGADRMSEVTLPNGTSASIVYFSDGRVSEVTVDPAGAEPAKTTEFQFTDEPNRRTLVIPPDAPHVIYDIGADGSVLKWWNVEEPPTFDKLSGSLIVGKGKTIGTGVHNLEIQAHSEEGVSSIQVVANGHHLVDEATCQKPDVIECKTLLNEWVTETSMHAPGVLFLEVIATDRLKHSISERFWVDIPYTPPDPPGEIDPPTFFDILKFREDYGLEVIFPVASELELNNRIFNLMIAWDNPETPAGQVARASWERWGIPLRAEDVAELEYRERYLAHNGPLIAEWGETNYPSSYAGYFMDHRAGGKIRVGFNAEQVNQVASLVQQGNLMAVDRIAPFDFQPAWSLSQLRGISLGFDQKVGSHPEITSLLSTGQVDVRSNKVLIGATNTGPVNGFLQAEFGPTTAIGTFHDSNPSGARNVWLENGARAREINARLFAGDWIRLTSEGGCTLGFSTWEEKPNSKPNGERVFNHYGLTAGHCFAKGDRIKRAGYVIENGKKVEKNTKLAFGTVERRPRTIVQEGFVTDIEAIDLDSTTEVPRWIYMDGVQQMINGSAEWVPGMTLCYSGTYGHHHCGPTRPEPVKNYYLGPPTWLIEIDAYGEAGDSGGPVWNPVTGEAIGSVSAGPEVGAPTEISTLHSLEGKPYAKEVMPGTAPGILGAPEMTTPVPMYLIDGVG